MRTMVRSELTIWKDPPRRKAWLLTSCWYGFEIEVGKSNSFFFSFQNQCSEVHYLQVSITLHAAFSILTYTLSNNGLFSRVHHIPSMVIFRAFSFFWPHLVSAQLNLIDRCFSWVLRLIACSLTGFHVSTLGDAKEQRSGKYGQKWAVLSWWGAELIYPWRLIMQNTRVAASAEASEWQSLGWIIVGSGD